jgi:hypothetical protein
MNTIPFSVLPALLAFFAGLLHMPALEVIRVDARGLGHERMTKWRAAGVSLSRRLGLNRREVWLPAAAVALFIIAALVFDVRTVLAAPVIFGVLTETGHTAQFLLSEAADGSWRSRESVTVLSGENLKAGHVVGRRLVSPTVAAAAAASGNTGNGTVTGQAVGTNLGAQRGDYKIVCVEPGTNLGTFIVHDPSGIVVGTAVVGTLFDNQIKFTINDGATDFVSGDTFTISVTGGTYKYQEYDPSNTDGGQRVAGILYGDVDASSADKAGTVIARDAEVRSADLVWFSGATTTQKNVAIDALAKLGIIARS